MTIFVAGATGALGRRVVPALVAAGHEVTAIGRSPEKRAMLARFGASPIDVDLFDRDALRRAVAGHRTVINLATKIPPSSQAFLPWAWKENSRIRSVGSHNLVDAARNGGAARFIQESFAPMYEAQGETWIDEDAPLRPAPHTRPAVDAEAAAASFADGGRTAVVLRFAFFYGADSGYSRDMVRFARLGIAAAMGGPEGYHSAISHDDAGSAVVTALELAGGTYNVVDCEPLRRREYFAAMAEAFGFAPPRFLPDWVTPLTGSVGETLARSQRISSLKLRKCSDWRPTLRSAREGWKLVATELAGERASA